MINRERTLIIYILNVRIVFINTYTRSWEITRSENK